MFSLAALDNADGGKYTPDGRVFVDVSGGLWRVLGSEIDDLTARASGPLLAPQVSVSARDADLGSLEAKGALDVAVTDAQIQKRMDEIKKQYYDNDQKKFETQVKKLGEAPTDAQRADLAASTQAAGSGTTTFGPRTLFAAASAAVSAWL